MAESKKDDYQHIRMLEEAEQNQDAANPESAGDFRVSDVQYIDGDVESVKPFLAETHAKMLEETGGVDALIERTRERYSAKIESGEIPQAILDKEIELFELAGEDSNAYAEARFDSNDFYAEQAASMGIDPEAINDYTIHLEHTGATTVQVDPVEEQQRRDTDARVVREAAEADAQQAAMGEMNLMVFFEMLLAMISGDQDALDNLMDKLKNNGQDNTPTQEDANPSQENDATTEVAEDPTPRDDQEEPSPVQDGDAPAEVAQEPTPQVEQEEPSPAQNEDAPTQVAQEPTPEVDQEAVPATQENDEPSAPVPEDDNGGPTEIAQAEPQGYVNEGLGPLLTEVNKPADEQVSPLIASAMQDDVPQSNSILGSIFSANAGNEVGNENVIQVPFAPEAPVEDPQAQPMEIANESTQPEQADLVNTQVLTMR